MVFTAWADGRFEIGGKTVRAALGVAGVIAAADKREGDRASPAGAWPIVQVLYRPDRIAPPKTALRVEPIRPEDLWCDAPDDPAYNRPVKAPFPARCEALWREDHVYDLVVVLAHNMNPTVPGLGSAVFLHLAREDYAPTEGCIAIARPDMEAFLAAARPGDKVCIRA